MVAANSYLQHVFIPQFWNKQLTVKSKADSSEYKILPTNIDLDNICVTKEYRKILNDHTFSYGNKFYFIESPIKHSISHQKIEIRSVTKYSFDTYFASRHLSVSEVIEPIKTSMEDIEIQKNVDIIAQCVRRYQAYNDVILGYFPSVG